MPRATGGVDHRHDAVPRGVRHFEKIAIHGGGIEGMILNLAEHEAGESGIEWFENKRMKLAGRDGVFRSTM